MTVLRYFDGASEEFVVRQNSSEFRCQNLKNSKAAATPFEISMEMFLMSHDDDSHHILR